MDPILSQNPDAPPRLQPEVPRNTTAQGSDGNPLRKVIGIWLEKIKKAWDFKQKEFGNDAITIMKFFDGPYDFLYKALYSGGNPDSGFTMNGGDDPDDAPPAPTFQMTLNKVAEGVQLFGPVLYHKNPYRQVNPRDLPPLPFGLFPMMMNGGVAPPPIPPPMPPGMPPLPPPGGPPGAPPHAGPPGVANPAMMPMVNPAVIAMQLQEQHFQQLEQQTKAMDDARAGLMEWVLNYTVGEYDLKRDARVAVDEGLIAGMSFLWPEPYVSPAGGKLIRSTWCSQQDILYDPDSTTRDECQWMARRRTLPVWKAERKFQLPQGSLKGHNESLGQQATVNVGDPNVADWKRKKGETNDLFTYWEIYSRMGVGGRLKGIDDATANVLEQFGDNVYLCVAEGVHYPLNVPNEMMADPNAMQTIMQRFEWPTAYWYGDAWPTEPITFHERPGKLYPMSHFKPALGELMFLNWVYSCMASKIQVTSRDFLAMKKSAGEDIKAKLLHGKDLTLLEIEATAPGSISEIVQFLQHPEWNGDIWKVVEKIEQNFEKRTGLSELMYGMSSRQMRSASEAELKGDAINVRPDDMANKVEDWMAKIARLEAMATRWHVTSQDVEPLMGPAHAYYWSVLVQNADPYTMFHQLQYSIEAGSTRKPNRERDAQNMKDAMQQIWPFATQLAMQTGNMTQVEALKNDWFRTMGGDGSKYPFPMPPPPMPVAPAGPGGPAPTPQPQ